MLNSNSGSDLFESKLKRVLVILSQHLLAAGILHMLNREIDLNVFDTTCDDPATLLQHIKDVKPTVLVMDECSQLSDIQAFFSLLNGYPNLRVIVIDERKNRLQIYKINEIEIERSTDLLTAIRGEEQLLSGGNGHG